MRGGGLKILGFMGRGRWTGSVSRKVGRAPASPATHGYGRAWASSPRSPHGPILERRWGAGHIGGPTPAGTKPTGSGPYRIQIPSAKEFATNWLRVGVPPSWPGPALDPRCSRLPRPRPRAPNELHEEPYLVAKQRSSVPGLGGRGEAKWHSNPCHPIICDELGLNGSSTSLARHRLSAKVRGRRPGPPSGESLQVVATGLRGDLSWWDTDGSRPDRESPGAVGRRRRGTTAP